MYFIYTQKIHLGTGVVGVIGNGVKFHDDIFKREAARLAAITVFFISMATVIGPTPPGTGVMYDATYLASLNATSPTNRWPLFLVASIKKLKNAIKLAN